MSNTFVTTIRFNLDREEDRRALDYLRSKGRNRYGSYTQAIIGILNSAASQQGERSSELDEETDKGDDFLRKVEETVRKAIDESTLGSMAALMRMMQAAPLAVPITEKAQLSSEVVEDEAEEDWSGADDFMNAMQP